MKRHVHKILYVFLLIHFFPLPKWTIGQQNARSVSEATYRNLNSLTASRTKIVILRDKTCLHVYEGDTLFKTYIVAVGNTAMGKPTPAGHFKVVNKLKDPAMVWRSGKVIPPNDPRNSYGARWIGLASYVTGRYKGCGIQGTNMETSIGKQITVGSIRMHNNDIIELYDLVDLGTEVVIR